MRGSSSSSILMQRVFSIAWRDGESTPYTGMVVFPIGGYDSDCEWAEAAWDERRCVNEVNRLIERCVSVFGDNCFPCSNRTTLGRSVARTLRRNESLSNPYSAYWHGLDGGLETKKVSMYTTMRATAGLPHCSNSSTRILVVAVPPPTQFLPIQTATLPIWSIATMTMTTLLHMVVTTLCMRKTTTTTPRFRQFICRHTATMPTVFAVVQQNSSHLAGSRTLSRLLLGILLRAKRHWTLLRRRQCAKLLVVPLRRGRQCPCRGTLLFNYIVPALYH